MSFLYLSMVLNRWF